MQDSLLVVGIGFSVVFVGLLCLILIISLSSRVIGLFKKDRPIKKRRSKEEVLPEYGPAPAAPEMGRSSVELSGAERKAFIAAVSCALAEYMGKDVEGVRICSVRRVGGSSFDPERRRLIAAISAAVAEEMGKDVSGIRIRSIRKVS